jgi:hypothetical protein
MHELAQTNLQLYSQLIARGWSDADLARTRCAYELATDLFAGQLRPCGKTFLAHVVGTASALATIGARADLVDAGLLHAAYTHGEFGDGRRDAAESKRAVVRTAIGFTAESLVAAYAMQRYESATVEDWLRRADVLTPTERDLALLRLANEVDEHADLGIRFADRGSDPAASDAVFAELAALAEKLHEFALADLLRRVASQEHDTTVPDVLRSSATRSLTTAPRSHRLRLELALRRTTWAQRLRRIPAVRRAYRSLHKAD